MCELSSSIRHFMRDTHGAITVDWTVLTAGLVGLALAVAAVVATGVSTQTAALHSDFATDHTAIDTKSFGRTPREVAMAYEMESLSPNRQARRVDTLLTHLSEKQLRNQHRKWYKRAADPAYNNPGLARDQVKLIDVAMQARGVTPHNNVPSLPTS